MSHRRWLATAAALVALAATAPAHAGEDPVDLVNRAAANAVAQAGKAANDVQHAINRDVGPGGGVVLPGGGGGFPPNGFAVTAVTWTMAPGQTTPSFTPPNPATSHPAAWSCTTSTTATTAHASCTPTGPLDPGTAGWSCYDPFVIGDVNGPIPGADSITGESHCGTSSALCTAVSGAGAPPGECRNWSFVQVPTPLECEADFSKASLLATWSVRCAPIDP
jgi:hypothetical protein